MDNPHAKDKGTMMFISGNYQEQINCPSINGQVNILVKNEIQILRKE
jgi:hypothetical protein